MTQIETTDTSEPIQNPAELPGNWETEEEYHDGNFKLVAKYRSPETGEKITISPYKSYDNAPGFCDSHLVEYWPDSGTWETVVKGLSDAEHPEDAKLKAIQKMREVASDV